MTTGTYGPPAGYVGPSFTPAQVQATIAAVATSYGVNPALAEADAQHESGGNPYSIGDSGSSFGLFQLHQGGELGSVPGATLHDKAQNAFDPTTNAQVALSRFAAVQAANPGLDPGMIAQLAERPKIDPKNPNAYANAVDAIMGNGSGVPGSTPGTSAPGVGTTAGATNAADTSTAVPPFKKGTQSICLGPGKIGIGPLSTGNPACITIWSWGRIAISILGALLLLIGIDVMFKTGMVSSALTPRGAMVPEEAPAAAPAAAPAPKPAAAPKPAPKPAGGAPGFYTKPPTKARARGPVGTKARTPVKAAAKAAPAAALA